MTNLKDTLCKVPQLAELPESRIDWLIEQTTEIYLQPGELHHREGDRAEHVFILSEGEVRITQKVGNQEVLLTTYQAKTLFGEVPVLLGDELFWASGRAVPHCRIKLLQRDCKTSLSTSICPIKSQAAKS